MSLQVIETIPIFRIFDLKKAREFYIDYLGFAMDWQHQFAGQGPVYMQISRSGCVLHLSEHYGDCCPGSTVFLRVSGIEDYHRELSTKGYAYLNPEVEKTFHDSLSLQLTDPFGNRLRLDEALEKQGTQH